MVADNDNRSTTAIDQHQTLLQRFFNRLGGKIMFHVVRGREWSGCQIENLFVHDDFLSIQYSWCGGRLNAAFGDSVSFERPKDLGKALEWTVHKRVPNVRVNETESDRQHQTAKQNPFANVDHLIGAWRFSFH